MTTYKIRFVHKIAPKPAEYHDKTVSLDAGASWQQIAALLRACGALLKGQRIIVEGSVWSRKEADGQILVFPCASIWHCIVLEPQS